MVFHGVFAPGRFDTGWNTTAVEADGSWTQISGTSTPSVLPSWTRRVMGAWVPCEAWRPMTTPTTRPANLQVLTQAEHKLKTARDAAARAAAAAAAVPAAKKRRRQ